MSESLWRSIGDQEACFTCTRAEPRAHLSRAAERCRGVQVSLNGDRRTCLRRERVSITNGARRNGYLYRHSIRSALRIELPPVGRPPACDLPNPFGDPVSLSKSISLGDAVTFWHPMGCGATRIPRPFSRGRAAVCRLSDTTPIRAVGVKLYGPFSFQRGIT